MRNKVGERGGGGERGSRVTHTFNEDTSCLDCGCGPLLELRQEVESMEGVHVLDVAEDDVFFPLQSAGENL